MGKRCGQYARSEMAEVGQTCFSHPVTFENNAIESTHPESLNMKVDAFLREFSYCRSSCLSEPVLRDETVS